MVPKAPALRLPLGARKFVRLSRLNASKRNSKRAGPPSAKRFDSAVSSCQNFGPLTVLRPALPKGWLGSVGTLTQSRLNQFVIVWALPCAYGSQLTFGR